ncbi:MAG: c-type cytochrome [Parahaliea sp.]
MSIAAAHHPHPSSTTRWPGPARRQWALLLAPLLVAGAIAQEVQAPSDEVRVAAEACAGCHSSSGASGGPGSPANLSALPPARIAKLMTTFRQDPGNNPVMSTIARAYSAQQVAALAAYLGAPVRKPADD